VDLVEDGIDVVARPAQPHPTSAPNRPAETQTSARQAALVFPGEFDPSTVTDPAKGLELIRTELGECTRCRLHEERQNLVFGEGNPQAPVVFVGEGPGAEEDRTGRPFVGRAGELLTKIIESVGWQRESVYICNIVKCRPPGNREPQPDEVATCRPFLDKQLLTIRPQVIVTLGKPAASTLLGRTIAITKTRGTWQEWNGIPLMPTFHPAYLLRNYTRETRQAVWDDLRAVRAHVDQAARR
jgi:DNA polymerase